MLIRLIALAVACLSGCCDCPDPKAVDAVDSRIRHEYVSLDEELPRECRSWVVGCKSCGECGFVNSEIPPERHFCGGELRVFAEVSEGDKVSGAMRNPFPGKERLILFLPGIGVTP